MTAAAYMQITNHVVALRDQLCWRVWSCCAVVLEGSECTLSLGMGSSVVPLCLAADGVVNVHGRSCLRMLSELLTCVVGSLNRAEWLKFMGLFFNMDDFANTVFDEINSTYYNNSATYKAAGATRSNTTTVAWVDRIDNITDYANAFEVSYAQYKVQYTSDAGGNMTNQSIVAAMTDVIASPYTVNTQWFAWDLVDVGLTGGFATQAAAITAFHSFLQTVSS